ncbi:hypothetical protein AQUCO_00200805v1 [Aquilegia coerulea]|uniref:UDP-glycosyltransferases domain-containing protein n=1 Tax=Aquilegia coerulea TaxID=218851 RepID=A0A2G5F4Z1_AQUCA|nr:hypothetical protein AQUCO_00200805v1 [Aquilegia coerulea]
MFPPVQVHSILFLVNCLRLQPNGIILAGTLVKDQTIQLSPRMPLMRTNHFVWKCIGDLKTQKVAFDATIVYNEAVKSVNWHLCNTSYELEPASFDLVPNVLPIGPLLASSGPRQSLGRFWPEDSSCLNWLNQQAARSVIYVAFGSLTVFDRIQFQELAMGLELSNQPFLWVVRPDMTKESSDVYPDGFQTRVAAQGQMVAWAPQQKVLSHPSVACFISHCGWNSTMESLSNGVPFLCWPFFADQFQNQSLICDVWMVGLGLNKNENGIVPRQEIKEKVNELLANDGIRTRVTELKETIKKSVGQGGNSTKNLDKFVKAMQI